MFNRHRRCINPSCRKVFDPVNPAANCCSKSCGNRINYLKALAKKHGITDPRLIWAFVVIQSFLDQRKLFTTTEELESLNVDFNCFPPPLPMNKGDDPSVLCAGNLGLVLIRDNVLRIVKQKK